MNAYQSLLVGAAYLLVGVAVAMWARGVLRKESERDYQKLLNGHPGVDAAGAAKFLLGLCMLVWPVVAVFGIVDAIQNRHR